MTYSPKNTVYTIFNVVKFVDIILTYSLKIVMQPVNANFYHAFVNVNKYKY